MTKVSGISAIIIWTARLHEVVNFYRALGVALEDEQHEKGPKHFACEIGTTHFAIFEGTVGECCKRGQSGATQIGLAVDDVDKAFRIAKGSGAEIIWEPRDMPWGRAALVSDPDGRAVELNSAPEEPKEHAPGTT